MRKLIPHNIEDAIKFPQLKKIFANHILSGNNLIMPAGEKHFTQEMF